MKRDRAAGEKLIRESCAAAQRLRAEARRSPEPKRSGLRRAAEIYDDVARLKRHELRGRDG